MPRTRNPESSTKALKGVQDAAVYFACRKDEGGESTWSIDGLSLYDENYEYKLRKKYCAQKEMLKDQKKELESNYKTLIKFVKKDGAECLLRIPPYEPSQISSSGTKSDSKEEAARLLGYFNRSTGNGDTDGFILGLRVSYMEELKKRYKQRKKVIKEEQKVLKSNYEKLSKFIKKKDGLERLRALFYESTQDSLSRRPGG